MVVGNDDVHTESAGLLHFCYPLYAAVRCDYERNAVLFGLFDSGNAHIVAVALAMRHEHVHIRAETSQDTSPQGRRGHAVAIVIAMHQNLFFLVQCGFQAFAGGADVGQQHRVVHSVEVGIKERIGEGGRVHTALHEQQGHNRMHSEFHDERGFGLRVAGNRAPAFVSGGRGMSGIMSAFCCCIC